MDDMEPYWEMEPGPRREWLEENAWFHMHVAEKDGRVIFLANQKLLPAGRFHNYIKIIWKAFIKYIKQVFKLVGGGTGKVHFTNKTIKRVQDDDEWYDGLYHAEEGESNAVHFYMVWPGDCPDDKEYAFNYVDLHDGGGVFLKKALYLLKKIGWKSIVLR